MSLNNSGLRAMKNSLKKDVTSKDFNKIYKEIFDYFADNHDITLLNGEIDDIISLIDNRFKND